MQYIGICLSGLAIGGAGIGIGSLLAIVMRGLNKQWIAYLTFLCAGIILVFVALEIIPESIGMGGPVIPIVGLALGAVIVRGMERFSHRIVYIPLDSGGGKGLPQAGMLLAAAVALHNFPGGLAFGATLLQDPQLAKEVALTMIIHSIPEGLFIGIPLLQGGARPQAALLTTFMVALPTAAGAFVGHTIGVIMPSAVSLTLGFAVGTILYVTLWEILLPAAEDNGWIKAIAGVLTGIGVGYVLLM